MGARQEAEQLTSLSCGIGKGKMSMRKGLWGLCAAWGAGRAWRSVLQGKEEVDQPHQRPLHIDKKRPAAGTCQPKVSSSIGFRPGQAEPKTFSGRLSDFPTLAICAQLWFEGAGGRPPAATAPPSEAISTEGGEPRLWGSVAAHARVEPPEQVVACASDHAHLGHGKGAAAQLEGDAVGVERRSRATALCSFCSRQAELQTGARRPNKYDT